MVNPKQIINEVIAMSDDNRNTIIENMNKFGLSFTNPNAESEAMKYHNFNSDLGTPVSLNNLQMNQGVQYSFIPGTQVATNQLIGTVENPEDVFDNLYPTNTIPQAPSMFAVNSKNSLNQESGKDAAAGDIRRSKNLLQLNLY